MCDAKTVPNKTVPNMTPDDDDEALRDRDLSDWAREIVDKKRSNADETVVVNDDVNDRFERLLPWLILSFGFAIAAFVSAPMLVFHGDRSELSHDFWMLLTFGSPVCWLITVLISADTLGRDAFYLLFSAPVVFFWWVVGFLLYLVLAPLGDVGSIQNSVGFSLAGLI